MSSFNIEEILINLKNTYLSTDKTVLKNSEKKLSELKEQNIVLFSSKLLDILKLNINEIDSNLRLSIILLLKQSIKEKIENKLLDKNSNDQLIQIYITILVNPNLSHKEIDNLNEAFLLLLNNTTGDILIEIITYINNQISSMPLGSVNGIISIFSSIIESSIQKNKKIFVVVLEGILNMSTSIAESLYNKYDDINPEKNLEEYLNLNTIFLNIFYLFFRCNVLTNKKYHIKNENFENFFEKISILGIKILVDLKAKDNNRIISWSGDNNKDKKINNMKINILKYLNFHITQIEQIITDKNKVENHNQFIKIILSNIEWVIMNKFTYLIKIESSDEYPDNGYSRIISFMFIYLKRIFIKDNFIHEYTTDFNSMYKNILLPLLLIKDIEEQIALDDESSNGYIIDMDDVIYKNKEKSIKSTVSSLIKTIFLKNNISNSFMMKYTIGLLDYLINNNISNSEDKALFDQNDIIILLLKAYPKDKIICDLFLALNIFSTIKDYPNKIENLNLLKKIYKNSFESFISNLTYPPLVHQFILFIKNSSIDLFIGNNNILEMNFSYIYNCLLDMKHLLISTSAAETLQYFINYDFRYNPQSKLILFKATQKIYKKLENQIIEVQISNFFDVLYLIIDNFWNLESEFLKVIFGKVSRRLYIEIERHSRLKFSVKKDINNSKKNAFQKSNLINSKIIKNKCFNIIKLLINNRKFVENNYNMIETALKPLVAYMDEPNKIDFDEEIINIIYSIILKMQKITGLGYNLIKNIYKYIDKVGGLLLDSYQLLNLYLIYGTEQILSNQKWIDSFFLAFKSGLKSDNFNRSGLYTSILIQTWMINCKKIPNDSLSNFIDIIINNINQILINNDSSKYMDEERYDLLGYITIILSGLINYSNVIIPSLQKASSENELKNWLEIIVKENEIIFEYEIKMIIYSICMIIKNGIITGDIKYLLNISIDLLKCQENNGKYELKKSTYKCLQFCFVEDEDEEDEEFNEYKEINKLAKITINPVRDFDEFQNFNALLNYLKQNKTDVYNSWENSLSEDKKIEINKLLGVKRIKIKYNDNSVNVPRRIVSLKRNINK